MSSDTYTSEITNIYHSLVNQFASPQDAWVYAHSKAIFLDTLNLFREHHKSNCYMESKGSPIGEATYLCCLISRLPSCSYLANIATETTKVISNYQGFLQNLLVCTVMRLVPRHGIQFRRR